MVTHFLLLILVLAAVVLYFMKPAERTGLLRAILAALHKVREAATLEGLQCDPFFDALRARTRRLIATPALIVLSVFVHSGAFDLLISAICLWQIGVILERFVGPLAFTTVYVASAVAAAIVSLSVSPDGTTAGASASVLGMYGLLLVVSTWSAIQHSSLTIPMNVAKRLAPFAGVFFLYKLAATGLGNPAEVAALACGLVGGITVARDVNERTPQIRRLATAMATVVTVATLCAVIMVHRPLNETVDVRPDIDRVIAVESRTARLYEVEIDRFRKGRITAAALADVIEKQIVPELQVVAARLRTLQGVPPEHQRLVAAAEQFLKLRDESWRLRAVALHKSDMPGLRRADGKEMASLEAFHLLRTPI